MRFLMQGCWAFSSKTSNFLWEVGENRAVEMRNCVAVASKSSHTNRIDCMSRLLLTWRRILPSSSGGHGIPMTTAFCLQSLGKEDGIDLDLVSTEHLI